MKTLTKKKVSVVIPVYNTSVAFLKECFNSVFNQDYKEKELIIVDDGSTVEETVNFCKEYAESRREMCIYIRKNNEGVSIARLEGLNNASGEYVMFVDSDDSLPLGAITRLVNVKNEYGCDAVISQDTVREKISAVNVIKGNKTLLEALYDNFDSSFGWALWGKLFDTVLMQYYYKAYKNIHYGEDLLVNADYFSNCQSAVVINEALYNYRKDNEASAMHQATSVKKLSLIDMWKQMAEIYRANNVTEYVPKLLANYYDSLLSGYLQCEYYRYDNYKTIMKSIKATMSEQLPDILSNRYVNGKAKYVIALYALWIFKLKRKISKK